MHDMVWKRRTVVASAERTSCVHGRLCGSGSIRELFWACGVSQSGKRQHRVRRSNGAREGPGAGLCTLKTKAEDGGSPQSWSRAISTHASCREHAVAGPKHDLWCSEGGNGGSMEHGGGGRGSMVVVGSGSRAHARPSSCIRASD